MERLPCGCRMGTDEPTKSFLIEPCALDCKYYLYALEQCAAQGKPTSAINVGPERPVLAIKMLPCPECGKLIGCKWDFDTQRAEPVKSCAEHSRHEARA